MRMVETISKTCLHNIHSTQTQILRVSNFTFQDRDLTLPFIIKLVLTLLDKVLKKALFAINAIFTSKDSIDSE